MFSYSVGLNAYLAIFYMCVDKRNKYIFYQIVMVKLKLLEHYICKILNDIRLENILANDIRLLKQYRPALHILCM